MINSSVTFEKPVNEPVLSYAPGSAEAAALKAELQRLRSSDMEIPLIIDGREVRSGKQGRCRIPHDHGHVLGTYDRASAAEVQQAIAAARRAAPGWAAMPWEDRLAIFERAAELIAGPRRMTLNAATMLGQSKNAHQSEIDAVCELSDFLRFNPYYAARIFSQQPESPQGERNVIEYRPLEGFVLAVTPFNFTAIGGNLPSAPAMLGNTVLWKPASSAVYSAYQVMKVFMEAGLPDGVINFLPGAGAEVGPSALESPDLAGIHFTGSTAVFQSIWKSVGSRIGQYRTYPRLVGETGGKDFIFAHESAPVDALVTAMVRGAFEYQGQKCSAASRAYIPRSLWDAVRERLLDTLATVKMGPPEDFSNFVNAVIDRPAFDKITGVLRQVREQSQARILAGGGWDDSTGYFIEPTVILTEDPHFRTMTEELFGPVLTVYTYDERQYEQALQLCDRTSGYGLTGAVFGRDRQAILTARETLVHAAGNFYINDKPTGAVVGRQPFGGGRASGTNDKAGSGFNLIRWLSPRTIKENFNPPTDYRYAFMG